MQLNEFVWRLYRESEQGKSAITRFSKFRKALSDGSYSLDFFGIDYAGEPLKPWQDDAQIIKSVTSLTSAASIKTDTQASRFFAKLVRKRMNVTLDGKVISLETEDLLNCIQPLSIGLHLAHPEFFIPYGFRTHFDVLASIADLFSLSIPPLPRKNDIEGKLDYYSLINQSIQEFRRLHSLSPAETCAFLYDFAPNFTREEEMPEPSKVWLHIGGVDNDDFDTLEQAEPSSQFHWQGNLEARRGDIVVMYVTSPKSCIHSVWRAASDGFVDPFFARHNTVWISDPIKTVPITIRELREHELFAKNAYVRASFQGSGGKPLSAEEYGALLRMLKARGQNTSAFPRLPRHSFVPSDKLNNERDVEIRLVEPLLLRLGYSPRDWVRQLPVRMGRGERVYPDYAFGAKKNRGEESAAMVLETKFSLSRGKDLREAYLQMRSYALRLQADKAVLAAREGIWIFVPNAGSFTLDQHTDFNWRELESPDALHAVRRLIGK